MKSIARRLLETIKENETPVVAPKVEGEEAPVADKDGAQPKDPAADGLDKDGDDQMDKMGNMTEMMVDPDKMAGALDAMHEKCKSYMDEADDSTYTCPGMAEKEDVEQAMGHMQEAMMKMRGKKK